MSDHDPPTWPGWPGRLLSIALSGGLLAVLVLAVLSIDDTSEGLTPAVLEQLDQSGVEHPPTAVLLNFRAYDTWLEVVVLLLASLGALVLRQSTRLPEQPVAGSAGPILNWLVRMLIPVGIVTGMYLLWRGTEAPGGAFQAGAVIGGGLILLRLSGYRSVGLLPAVGLRGSLLCGFGGFLLIGTGLFIGGQGFLTYPPSQAGLLIVVIELLITWTVAISFVALLVAASPDSDAAVREPERDRQ